MRVSGLIAVLIASVITVGGCNRDMKVTFANHTPQIVPIEFVSAAGEHGPARVDVGLLEPGKEKVVYKRYEGVLLPCDFSITIFAASPKTQTKIVRIPEKYYRKLQVDIDPDEDMGVIINVSDENGDTIPTR